MKFLRTLLIAFLLPTLVWAQNIPLVINSGVPQQLPAANTLVDANSNPFGLMIGSFTPGDCLAAGSAANKIVDSGVVGCLGTLTGSQNKIFATPNGSSGSPTLRAMVIADMPLTGVTAGSYTCVNGTWDAEGLATALANGSCAGGVTLSFPGYTCTNTGGNIVCSAPCSGFPIVSCSINSNTQSPLLTLTTKPAVGDLLVSATAVNTGASPSPQAGWTEVSVCSQQAVAYHVVTAFDGQTYVPWNWNGAGQLSTQVMADVTAMGAAGGSWASAYNSTACNTSGAGGSGSVTQSGTTPASGAVQLALGTYVDSNSTGMTVSLTGIANDVQYAVPAAGGTQGHNQAAAMGYNVGGAGGSGYSATWTWSGGGIGAAPFLSVMFFNAGSGASAPACTPSSGSCAMTANAGPAALYMTLSSAGSASTLALSSLPTVANDYVCAPLMDKTTGSIWGLQSGWSATGATFTFYTKGSATAANPGASDVVMATCWGT